MRKDHVAEEVLGAYVDGELDADAIARIEERLSSDRALRDRLAALQRVTDLVRTAAHATPPADSQASAATHTRTGGASRAGPNDARSERAPAAEPSRTFSRPVVWGIAASFVAALAGALLTVLLLGRDAGVDGWQQHALVFHESYLAALDANRTPLLDARASSPAALGKSLAALVDDELVVVPDLSEQGYAPQGARLIETAAGPVTYVVYAGVNKPVLGLAVLRSAPDDDGEQHMHQHGELKLLEWSDGEHRFGVGGTHSAASLRTLADAVQDFATGSATESGPSDPSI